MAKKNEAKIKFTAETGDFNDAIKKSNEELSELRAEMKKNDAQMKNTGESVEGLEKKHDILEKQLQASSDKTEALRGKLEKAKQIYGENSSEVSNLKVQLTNAKTAEEKLKTQINAVNSQLDKQAAEQKEAASATKQLTDTIEKQETELNQLKGEYVEAVLQYGKNSTEAQQLANKINSLSGELQENKTKLSDVNEAADKVDKTLDDVADGAKEAGDGFTVMKGAAADLLADGLKGVASTLWDISKASVTMANDVTKAANTFIAQTGASKDEAEAFQGVIKGIYENNFGESMEDIADSMATVKNNFGELDNASLQKLTEEALLLRDVFDFEVNESTRTASMLMKEFGIDAETAYAAIVTGAQNGLDRNGDLLDTLNEYTVHYSGLGYTVDDMLNSLVNGANEGTFSVDKLGDAMKEFGIRSKDTATSTTDALALIGYGAGKNAEEITKVEKEIEKLEKNLKYAKMEQENLNTGSLSSYNNEVKKTKEEIEKLEKNLAYAKTEQSNLNSGSLDAYNKEVSKVTDEIEKLEKNLKYAQTEQAGFNEKTSEAAKLKNADKIAEYSEKLEEARKKLADLTANQDSYTSSSNDLAKTKNADKIAEYSSELEAAKAKLEDLTNNQDKYTSSSNELAKVKNADKIKEYSDALKDAKAKLKAMTSESKNTKGSIADLQKKFAAGGETAQEATKEVLEALFEMEDEVDRNAAGVGLFGTMWEDLGEDAIKALMDTNGEIELTTEALEEINEIQYDDVGSRIEALGRTIQVDIAEKIGKKALPVVEDFVEYTAENLDDIIPIAKTLGATLVTVFAINKVSNFISSLSTLKTTFSALGATIAAHPIAAVATGVALATGAVVALNDAMDREIEKTWGLTEAEKTLNDAIEKRTQSVKDSNAARDEANKNIDVEAAQNQKLWKELQNIVDENGKIKKGYEDRASVITGLLADSLGIEIQIVDGQIQKYGELKKSIDEVIRTKRAEALLSANQDEYTNAIQEQSAAYAEYTDKIAQCEQSEKDLAKAQSNLDYLLEQSQYATSEEAALSYAWSITQAKKEVEVATEAHEKNTSALEDAQSNYFNYCSTIENYEGLMAAAANGDVAELENAMTRLSNSFLTAENATKEMLETQLSDFKTQYQNMKIAVEQGMPGVSQEQVEQMGLLVQGAEAELAKLTPKAEAKGKLAGVGFQTGLKFNSLRVQQAGADLAGKADTGLDTSNSGQIGNKKGSNFVGGIRSKNGDAYSAGSVLAKNLDSGANTSKSGSVGNSKGSQFAAGVKGTKGQAKTAGKTVATNADGGMSSVNPTSTGASFGTKFGSGITGKKASIYGAGGGLAESGKKGLKSVSTKGAGEDFADGFGEGIESKNSSVWNKAWSMAKNAWEAVCEALDINSPSRLTRSTGESFDEGFILGIDNDRDKAVEAAERLATDTTNALNGGVISSGFSFSFPDAKLPTFETTGKINFAATGGSRQYGYMEAAIQNASDMRDLTAAVAAVANRPVILNVNGRNFAEATASDTDSVNGLRSSFKQRGLILD